MKGKEALLYSIKNKITPSVPFSILLAAMKDPSVQSTFVDCFSTLSPAHQRVVLPLLPPDQAAQVLLDEPENKSINYLAMATPLQKLALLEKESASIAESVSNWDTKKKQLKAKVLNLQKLLDAEKRNDIKIISAYKNLESSFPRAYVATTRRPILQSQQWMNRIIMSLRKGTAQEFDNHNTVLRAQELIDNADQAMKEINELRQEIRIELADKVLSEPPEEFICPITKQIMKDPVYLENSGNTKRYERKALIKWLKSTPRNPITNESATEKNIKGDIDLKARIEQWHKKHLDRDAVDH